MKATMESTSRLLIVNGLNIRVWEGRTENGVPFVALVNRLQAVNPAQQTQLIAELAKTKEPIAEMDSVLVAIGVVTIPAPAEDAAAGAKTA